MTLIKQIITVAMVVIGTVITRFLPFIIFPDGKKTPDYLKYLGDVLPLAVFGLLIVYCLRDVSILHGSHGIPEFISIALTVGIHLWRRKMILSIAAGTVCYMILIHFVFL